MTESSFVIVGAGLAGAKTASALREQGYDGEVVLVGHEAHLPYDRPPLSKAYLKGESARRELDVHPERWYADEKIDLRLNSEVTALDPAAHTVTVDGAPVHYDKLLIATGSSPRTLPVPGADAAGVHYLRTLDDADALRAALERADAVGIVGAGWIGLEFAAAAREAGKPVTIVESLDLPLVRVLGREVATFFADLHRDHGVDLRLSAQLESIVAEDGKVAGLQLAGGETIAADLVLIGIGAAPNVGLAEAAGLDVDNGILVDAALRSSDPDIFAAGDVANEQHPLLGRRVRVEHWANALTQPEYVARSMRGEPVSYDELPFFYSDQYDVGMEYVGYVGPEDETTVVIRGDLSGREFMAFWLNPSGHVQAGMHSNVWDTVDDVKELITANRPVDPAKLADPDVPLADALG